MILPIINLLWVIMLLHNSLLCLSLDVSETVDNVKETTENVIGDVGDTLNTAPTAWDSHQWLIVSALALSGFIVLVCIYRCVPCTPRIC